MNQSIVLRHFTPQEFKGYWSKMNPALLRSLDDLRHHWRRAIHISPNPDGVGRETGSGHHNWVKHGSVMAVDVFTIINSMDELHSFIALAQKMGMHGVGLYPFWEPRSLGTGFHLDVGAQPGRTWSGIPDGSGEQVYRSLQDGLEVWSPRC